MQLSRCHLANAVELKTTLHLLITMFLLLSSTNGRPAFDGKRLGRGGDGASSTLALHPPPLHLVVSPDVTTINSSVERIRVTCSVTTDSMEDRSSDKDEVTAASDDLPYITFFWMVLEHTSMPLSSNIPGVTVVHRHVEEGGSLAKKHGSHRRRHGNDVSARRRPTNVDASYDYSTTQISSPDVATSSLIIDSRFYHVLHWGDNKFACKAMTLSGRRSAGFFTIRKI